MTANKTLPTINTFYKWYDYYNKIYFNNKLPIDINIEYSSRKSAIGDWSHSRRRLRITNQYILSERQYQEVLIHEMIHTYQTCVLGIKGSHNYTFKKKMYEININGGWNVQTKFPYKVEPLIKKEITTEWVVLIIENNERKCVVKTTEPYMYRELKKYRRWFDNIKVYRAKGRIFDMMRKNNVNSTKYYPFNLNEFKTRIEPYLLNEIMIAYN